MCAFQYKTFTCDKASFILSASAFLLGWCAGSNDQQQYGLDNGDYSDLLNNVLLRHVALNTNNLHLHTL